MSFDCRKCGACCRAIWEVVVEARVDDQVPRKLVKEGPYWDLMRTRKGCCIALRGEVGKSVTCSIYEQRPHDCRTFEPGSPDCRNARRRAKADGFPIEGLDVAGHGPEENR